MDHTFLSLNLALLSPDMIRIVNVQRICLFEYSSLTLSLSGHRKLSRRLSLCFNLLWKSLDIFCVVSLIINLLTVVRRRRGDSVRLVQIKVEEGYVNLA